MAIQKQPEEGRGSGATAILPEDQGLTRRTLLKHLAALGVAASGAGALLDQLDILRPAEAATTRKEAYEPEHAWCMVIDLRTCDGCKACTQACQQRHQLPEEQTWIEVVPMKDSAGGTFNMPMPCMMCEDPPCVQVCPVGATWREEEGGLTLVDQDICIGSRACMAGCPYEARYFNWDEPSPVNPMPYPPTPEMPVPQQMGTVGKCTLCADRLPQGELPACVDGCPMGVLYIGDLVTDIAVNGLGNAVVLSEFLRANDAIRAKEELGTNPRVYYILGHGQGLGDMT
jgi:dimethyl sulfoxide reductase iron-sulfur subunit